MSGIGLSIMEWADRMGVRAMIRHRRGSRIVVGLALIVIWSAFVWTVFLMVLG